MDRITGLQLFVRVVETGSFSQGATALGVSQPTATKHVAALEQQLGARLLHRSSRGVSTTEVGAAYYDACKALLRQLEEADSLASLMQSRVQGMLRISTSVAFGRRVLTPQVLRFMQSHPGLTLDLNFEDRYVDLVAQGMDLAIRMGRLADSSLGARFLGVNPWVLVAAPEYLERHGVPQTPSELSTHQALIYSSVQGDDRWQFSGRGGDTKVVPVHGPLRSNNLSALLAAARAGMGVAALPWYVAHESVRAQTVQALLTDWALPAQEIHAVYPSPRLVPSKVSGFVDWLQGQFEGEWWRR